MINTNYTTAVKTPDIYKKKEISQRNISPLGAVHFANTLKQDSISFTNNTTETKTTLQTPVTIKEGAKIFVGGIKTKFDDMAHELKMHPARTIALSAAAVGVVSLLPLISLPIAVGSSFLAAGFVGLTGYGAVKDCMDIAKNNKLGNYDKVRESIKNLAGNAVNIALLAPVVPKGFGQLKNAVQAGEAFKINNTLIETIQRAPTIESKVVAFLQGNANLACKLGSERITLPTILDPVMNKIPNIKNAVNGTLAAEEHTIATISTALGVNSISTMVAQRAKEIGLNEQVCKNVSSKAVNGVHSYFDNMLPLNSLLNIITQEKIPVDKVE